MDNGKYGRPQQINYADFNYPVPASAYRCQSKCWTEAVEPFTSFQASISHVTTNLCSTIWNDYAPILDIPAQLKTLNAVGADNETECYFAFDIGDVLYDPPTALTSQPSLRPVSMQPPSIAITTTSARQTAAPSNGPTLVTASQTDIPAPPQQTTLTSESGNDPKSVGIVASISGPTKPDPPKSSDPDSPTTSTRGIGVIIASVFHISKTRSSNEGSQPGQTTEPSDPQPTLYLSSTEGQVRISSYLVDPIATSADLSEGVEPTQIVTGAVLTAAGGTTLIASDASGRVAFGSVTLTPGQSTSVDGLGPVAVISSGVVVDGSTRLFSSLYPYGTKHVSGAVFTAPDGTPMTASEGSRYVAFGSMTLNYGQSTSIPGLGSIIALPSGIVINGETRLFSDLGPQAAYTSPRSTPTMSGAILTTANGEVVVASEVPGHAVIGSGTVADGETTSIQGIGTVEAIVSGLVVNGTTHLFSNLNPSTTGSAMASPEAAVNSASATLMSGSTASHSTSDARSTSLLPTSSPGLAENKAQPSICGSDTLVAVLAVLSVLISS